MLEVFKGEKAGCVAVGPDWLHSVASDAVQPDQLKRLGRQGFGRILVKIAHDIGFTFATRAWAITAQFLQGDKTFSAVLPLDGELIANRL